MQTEKFILKLDQSNRVFYGTFTNVSKTLINRLKEKNYIKHVIIDLFPETINGDIVIDVNNPDEETYDIDIYLNEVATDEMKEAIKKWKNRDIDINEDDETLEIHFKLQKTSPLIKTNDDEHEMILEL